MIASLFIGLAFESSAQLENFKSKRFQARLPGEIDTIGSDRGIQTSLGAALTLEREVDAAEYVLGPGDNLIVSIWSTESVHVTVPVTPEGKVVIPRAGVVSVKERTLADASKDIIEEVKKVYRSPRVDVSLASLRSFRVYVLGAVRVPSIIVANGVDRVFDVIQRAGGVLDTGSVRGITIVRDKAAKPILADLQRYLSTGDKRF
ncbi:MAG: polysaccharide biosynthesis/export family protein, partial [Candidatus Kapabacteria bacterium]|nr:polysaccharide biosynthesis/export family protein [Candidatus Kapabacteria bacterium]